MVSNDSSMQFFSDNVFNLIDEIVLSFDSFLSVFLVLDELTGLILNFPLNVMEISHLKHPYPGPKLWTPLHC